MGRGINDGTVPSGEGTPQTGQPDVGSQNGGAGVVQSGSSGQELPIQGQPPVGQSTPQGEPFLGISQENLSDDQRQSLREWETKYTQKRQAETEHIRQVESDASLYREKAEQFDTLSNNPDFIQWIMDKRNQQGSSQQGPSTPDLSFADDFEGAPAIKGMVESIMEGVRNTVAPLQQEMASLRSGMSRQQEDIEFDSLVQQAKQNGWTDPSALKRNMDFLGQQHPTLSLMNRYTIAERQYLSGGNIISQPLSAQLQNNQPPVVQEQTPSIPVVGDKGSPINPPGGTSAVTGSMGTSLSRLDEALKQRQENKGSPVRMNIEKYVNEAIDNMRARGENIDMRGL